eukprot:197660-Rhodomonas_salina.1
MKRKDLETRTSNVIQVLRHFRVKANKLPQCQASTGTVTQACTKLGAPRRNQTQLKQDIAGTDGVWRLRSRCDAGFGVHGASGSEVGRYGHSVWEDGMCSTAIIMIMIPLLASLAQWRPDE